MDLSRSLQSASPTQSRFRRSLHWLVRCLVILTLCATFRGTFADDDPAVPSDPTTPAAPAATNPAEVSPAPDRRIYLPYRNLTEVLKEHGATAIVPYEDYLKMIDESLRKIEPAVPVEALITQAAYRGVVTGDVARITAVYDITVLGTPWVELPLSFGDAAIGNVESAGKKVMLRGMGPGKYGLLIGESGELQVTIELVTTIKTSPDGREFSLAVPPVGISTLEVIVPEKQQAIQIPGAIVTATGGNNAAAADNEVEQVNENQSRVVATLGAGGTLSARWHPRGGMKPEMDLLSSVTNRQRLSIEDGLIHRDAWLTYQILRGSTSAVEFSVPTGQRILDVSADARVKSWKATDEPGRQLVVVELLAPADKELTVEVHTEESLPAGPFSLGGISETGQVRGIHSVGAVRENGQIAVGVGSDLMLTIADQQGVSRVDSTNVDPKLQGAGQQAWKYYTPQFQLTATVSQVQPRVIATQASRLTFTPDELQLVASIDLTVERAGLFDVKLKLPPQFVVDDVLCEAMQERSIDAAGEVMSLRLKEKTLGQFRIILRGHRDLNLAENQVEQDLPLVEPLGVERETGTVQVFAPPAIEVATNEKELQAVQPAPTQSGLRDGEAWLTSAWTYSRRPVRIPVRTTRKPTRLSVRIATMIDVQPEVIEVTTQLDALVEFAGIDTFQFLVPEGVSERVQIEVPANDHNSAPIKQKRAGGAENGWVLWTVETQREVIGQQRFLISYRLTDDLLSAPPAAIPVPAVPPVPPVADSDAAVPTPATSTVPVVDDPADPATTNKTSPLRAETPSEKVRTLLMIKPTGVAAIGPRAAVPLTQLSGEIRVEKERSLSLQGNATGGDVEPIDIRELSLVPSQGAIAYRYFRQPDEGSIAVELTAHRFEIQEVIPTIIQKGLIEIATSRHTDATYRSRFLIKSVERQRLRIDLPQNMELLGAFVDGREVKPSLVQGAVSRDLSVTPYDINVDRSTPSDVPFLLTLQFNWSVTPQPYEATYGRGELLLPLPRIGGTDAPALVQELRAVVYAPEGFWLVGTPDKFRVEGEPTWWDGLFYQPVAIPPQNLDDWIGDHSGTGLRLPVDNLVPTGYLNLGGAPSIQLIWWNRLTITLVFSISLAIVGFVLLPTSCENKIGLLLLLTFVACLVGLADHPVLTHGLTAARYGLLLLLVLWMVHSLLKMRLIVPAAPAVSTSVASTTDTDSSTTAPTSEVARESDVVSSSEALARDDAPIESRPDSPRPDTDPPPSRD